MALVNFSGSYGSHLKLEVLAGTVSQSVSGNSSVIRIWCNLISDGYASVYGATAPLTVHIDGVGAIEQVSVNINQNSKVTLWAKEYTIPHNSDGTKTVSLRLNVDIGVGGYGSAEYSWNYQLATIPRASPISASAGVIGSAMTLTIDRKSSGFTHTVRYNWQGNTGTVGTGIGTSTSYTPPLTFASNIPNSTSGTITFYCDTYNGSTLVGTSQTTATLTVPDSVVPTIDGLTLEETAEAMKGISTSTEFAQILSRVKATVTGASGVYGSTIKSYSITVVDQNLTLTENGGVFDFFKNNGTFTVRATVTDSRGRTSANKDVTINVVEYFTPVGSFSAVRSGANKDKLTVTRNAKVAPLKIGGVNRNTLSIQFKYAQRGSNIWINSTGNANENLTSTFELVNSQASLVETFSTAKSYDLIMVISDKFFSPEVKVPVGTITIPYAVTKDSFGIGKAPEISNSVDSAYKYYYNSNPIQHYKLTSDDGRSPYNAVGTVDLNTKTINSFFSCNSPTNGPTVRTGLNEFYVSVYSETDNYLSQQVIQKNSGRMFTRTRQAGTWTAWIEYAPLNSVAEFTSVNQTKVYTGFINGPYGFNATVTRCGNIVNLSFDVVYNNAHQVSGIASETVPVGWRPTTKQIITMTGHAGGGEGTKNWPANFVDLDYNSDGSIKYTIATETQPLAFRGSMTWITTDPFPAE